MKADSHLLNMLIKSNFTSPHLQEHNWLPKRREERLFCVWFHLKLTRLLSFSLLTFHRAIVALVYNVLKAFMEMNSTMFDELTATYKSDRQR